MTCLDFLLGPQITHTPGPEDITPSLCACNHTDVTLYGRVILPLNLILAVGKGSQPLSHTPGLSHSSSLKLMGN